jgi:hypothetical protein
MSYVTHAGEWDAPSTLGSLLEDGAFSEAHGWAGCVLKSVFGLCFGCTAQSHKAQFL